MPSNKKWIGDWDCIVIGCGSSTTALVNRWCRVGVIGNEYGNAKNANDKNESNEKRGNEEKCDLDESHARGGDGQDMLLNFNQRYTF